MFGNIIKSTNPENKIATVGTREEISAGNLEILLFALLRPEPAKSLKQIGESSPCVRVGACGPQAMERDQILVIDFSCDPEIETG